MTAEQADGRPNFRNIERKEWWLWAVAFVITFALMVGLLSFFLPDVRIHQEEYSLTSLPHVVRGLVGLVLIFDLYIIYQHLQIHRIRKQLLERDELFQLISENAADMIAVVNMEGGRLFNSLSYERILGYSVDELQASSGFQQIHPDDWECVQSATEEARRTGAGKTLEYRIRHKNGTWMELESTSSVIRNADGLPEKLVIVNRNITERKRAEKALRRSETDFRSVVEGAPYGIYRASPQGRFLQVNPALKKMLGYEFEEDLLKQELPCDVFQSSDECRRLNELLSCKGEIKDFETEWRKKDGTPITVRCSGRRIVGETDGAFFEVFAEDVTENRVLERQLRMAQKMEAIGRLSGGIAHDFNNLLGVIIGYSGVLKRSLRQQTELCEHAVEIEKAGQRAASLTKQLLAFSRQQVMSPSILNLNALVSDMENMLPRLLGEDIEVSLHLDANLGTVKADKSQIEQVIMNLAVNARDAMSKGGKLSIRTENVELDQAYVRTHSGSKAGKYVMLAVTDTGVGIDAATQAHIFEPFFTTKELGKGTGLGLATVYGIVKQSTGYIWVDSAPGQGASFQVYLPQQCEPVLPEESKHPAGEKLDGTETILLVEDAEPLRRLAQSLLEASGFRVLSAGTGEEALELAARSGRVFDLLLTDVVMPGMNGRALAEQMVARAPALRVLYMSGYTDSFIAGHGVLKPGVQLIHKPFTEEALLRKIREVLDTRNPSPVMSAIQL